MQPKLGSRERSSVGALQQLLSRSVTLSLSLKARAGLRLSCKFAKLWHFSNFYDFSRDGRVSSGELLYTDAGLHWLQLNDTTIYNHIVHNAAAAAQAATKFKKIYDSFLYTSFAVAI